MKQNHSANTKRLERYDRRLGLGKNVFGVLLFVSLLSSLLVFILQLSEKPVIKFGGLSISILFGFLSSITGRIRAKVREKLLPLLALEDERPPLFILRSFRYSSLTTEIVISSRGRGKQPKYERITHPLFNTSEATASIGPMVSLSQTPSEVHESRR